VIALTSKDVAFYEEHGWWVSPPIVSAELLSGAAAAMDRIWRGEYETREPPNGFFNPDDQPQAMRKANNGWRTDSGIRALATHPAIAACAARLIGADSIRLWEDQLLDKPGGGHPSANVGWHQDWTYWGGSVEVPRMITAWVPYQDISAANGALQFVDGSHRWDEVAASNFFETDRDEQLQRARAGHDAEVVTLDMRAGQVSFHHPLLLHGSGANLSGRPRRVTAVHLMAGDLRSARRAERFMHYNVDLLEQAGGQVGDIYDGEQWPVVYDASRQGARA
jgi:hypothetical protein